MAIQCSTHHSILEFDQDSWATIARGKGPFLRYEFLSALEQTDCVGLDTGWQPKFFAAQQDGQLVAAVPGYTKYDSYGEYVFDFAWANAYHQHGLDYYPKWVNGIPYTPVSGERLLLSDDVSHSSDIVDTLLPYIEQQQRKVSSSLHWLFTSVNSSDHIATHYPLKRLSVQFQWFNRGFHSFDDYLQTFTSRKRKDIRKARAKLDSQGIKIERFTGSNITDKVMAFFYTCYKQTYLKRSGHEGYLTQAFFERIAEQMADNLLVIQAEKSGIPVASALLFYDETGLYGRYWGTIEELDGLHFEVCYYQGVDFAIEHTLPLFNPGTQGEHKILRGFEPIFCYSHHHLFHEGFHEAVNRFLIQEKPAIERYYEQAFAALPFNQGYKESITTEDVNPTFSSQSHRENTL